MADTFGYLSRRGAAGWARRWIAVVAVALLVAVAHGQGAASARAVRFTVFAAKPVADLAFVPRAGAPPQKVMFYPTTRSPRYEYRGAMPVRFVDTTTGAVVAEATIPADMRDALLLFTPLEGATASGGKGRRFQVAVLDDSAARHAAGGLSIINLSGLTLSGTVNKEKVTLRAGLNPTLSVGRSAAIVFRTTFNKRTVQSYAATVPLAGKQRALLILFPPFYKGSLEVQSRVLVDEPPTTPKS